MENVGWPGELILGQKAIIHSIPGTTEVKSEAGFVNLVWALA